MSTITPFLWFNDKAEEAAQSWQIVPKALSRLLQQQEPGKSQRVMQALLQMKKIDIARLQQAATGG